jgi:hypothetical protein
MCPNGYRTSSGTDIGIDQLPSTTIVVTRMHDGSLHDSSALPYVFWSRWSRWRRFWTAAVSWFVRLRVNFELS